MVGNIALSCKNAIRSYVFWKAFALLDVDRSHIDILHDISKICHKFWYTVIGWNGG